MKVWAKTLCLQTTPSSHHLPSSLLPRLPLHSSTRDSEGVDCPICGVHFSGKYHKYNLKRHLDIHRGVRPYECKQCGHQFNRRHNLERHTERVHTQQSQPHGHVASSVNVNQLYNHPSNVTQSSFSAGGGVEAAEKVHRLQSHSVSSVETPDDRMEHRTQSQPRLPENPNPGIAAQHSL